MEITKRAEGFRARRVVLVAAGLLMMAGVAYSGAAQPSAAQPSAAQRTAAAIWSGTSAGYAIQWTSTDLTAHQAAGAVTPIFSARQLARKDFADLENEMSCEYDRHFTLLSVVGPIISYEDGYLSFCETAAHPGGETRFVAVDLSKPARARRGSDDTMLPGNAVKLTDYFPAAEIHKALLADAVIQKALDGKRPRTLAELLKLIGDEFPTVAEGEKSCFTLEPDLLTRFVFHHIEGNKVAVRLGLSGAGVCRNNLTQIGLLLPIPASLQQALANADAGSEGFLMNRKVGAGKQTLFHAETKKRPSRQ